MKSRPYMFVYDGKFLECESLLEIRAYAPESDWNIILKQTIIYYVQLKAASKIATLDRDDSRIMRSLKRTIDTIRPMDSMIGTPEDIDEIVNGYANIGINEAANNFNLGSNKPSPDPMNISVSNLDS